MPLFDFFKELAKQNPVAAKFISFGLLPLIAAAVVLSFGIGIEVLTKVGIVVVIFAVAMLALSALPALARGIFGWFLTILVMLWLGAVALQIITGNTAKIAGVKLAPIQCLLGPTGEACEVIRLASAASAPVVPLPPEITVEEEPLPTVLPDDTSTLVPLSDEPNVTGPLISDTPTSATEGLAAITDTPVLETPIVSAPPLDYDRIFVHYPGNISQDEIITFSGALVDDGWLVADPEGGGKETINALGYNQVRFFNGAQREAANELALAAAIFSPAGEPLSVVDLSGSRFATPESEGLLEVWLSR